ncbi:EpsG family protein [Raoultella ornithinolytica]|uniref:EpsG family protein n=1 Tax=Raoultella ornithinolytica TaxID=54291 RepID=UPI0027383375|nr:EpsG family protein [Raoultella ornithinolytica]WLP22256.1 EpsG family protein [Raoultella ornithinolytica]
MKGNDVFFKKKDVISYFILCIYILVCAYLVSEKSIITWGDYDVYKEYYHNAVTYSVSEIILDVQDPVFVLLMKVFTGSKYGFDNFLLFVAFLTLFFKMTSVFRRVENIYLFVFLYSSYYLCVHDYIQVRVSLALALVCIGMYWIPNKKMSLFFIITGCLVHLSTIIPVLVYYVVGRSDNNLRYKRFYYMVPLVLLIPLAFSMGFLSYYRIDRYLDYYNQASDKKGGLLRNMPLLVPALQVIGLLYIYARKKLRQNIFTFEYAISYIGILIFYSCISMPVIAIRIFDISTFFFIVLVSRMKCNIYVIFFSLAFSLINIRNTLILLGYNIPFFHFGS